MHRGLATWALTAAVVTASLVIAVLVGDTGDPAVLLRAGAMARTQIHAGEWWRVVSCVFVHVGFSHMVVNAISLLVIGVLCEDLLGSLRTLAVFFVAGIAGALFSYLASPEPVSAGASGAVMGLLGAVFMELTLNRARYRALWKRGVWGGVGLVVLCEVGIGFFYPVVDQWAHGAGLAAGALLGAALSPHVRWRTAQTYVAGAIAVAGVLVTGVAGVNVARTSVADSLAGVPKIAWTLHGVTIDAPAAWTVRDGELVDEDVFLVVAVERVAPAASAGVTKDLSAWVASEPERVTARHFDQVAPATERVVPLPLGWAGSEYEASYGDPLGDRVVYRVVVAGRELDGHVVLASVYAPDTLAREEPEILSDLLASARSAP
jgi:rhomboid protease GluP